MSDDNFYDEEEDEFMDNTDNLEEDAEDDKGLDLEYYDDDD